MAREIEQPPISEQELKEGMPKRRIGFLTWAIIVLISFIVLPLCGYFAWLGTTRQRYEKRISELSSSGQPMSAAGMQAFYALPDGVHDSTPLYVNALAVVTQAGFSSDVTGLPFVDRKADIMAPLPGQPWESRREAENLLAKYEGVLRSLHQAQQQGGQARYNLNFEDGFGTLLPHVNELPTVLNLLQLEAYCKAHQGDSAGVTQSIRSALAATRSLQHEPLIVSQLSSFYHVGQILDTIERLLSKVDFSDAELRLLQESVQAFDVRGSTRKAFLGEQGMCFIALGGSNEQLWNQFQLMGDTEQRAGSRATWMAASMGIRYDDLLLYSGYMQQFLNSIDKPWPTAIAEVEKVTDAARNATKGKFREFRFSLTRTCLAVPAYPSHMLRQAANTEAKLAICDVLVAAKRQLVQSGQLPTSIEELVPNQLPVSPADPLNPSSPLKLLKTKQRIRISSIGLVPNVDEKESNYWVPVTPAGEIRMELNTAP